MKVEKSVRLAQTVFLQTRQILKGLVLLFVSRLSLWYRSRRFDRTLQVFDHRLMKTCNVRSKRRDQYRETNDKSWTLYTHYSRWLISFMSRPKRKSMLEKNICQIFLPTHFSFSVLSWKILIIVDNAYKGFRFYRSSHDIDRDVSTANCRSSSGDDDDLQCAVETSWSISKWQSWDKQ